MFLKYNLVAEDEIFVEDIYGTFLTKRASITLHLPSLMAAMKVDSTMLEKIRVYAGIDDQLTLPNVSHIYRHVLLAKSLGLRVKQLPALIDLIKGKAHPFSRPTHTLDFYQRYDRINNSGFDIRELNYITRNKDDEERPVRPESGDVFRLAIKLRNALLQIDTDHADIKNDEEVTEELLRNKLSLLYEDAIVEQIIQLLQGTTVYQDNTRLKFSAILGKSSCNEVSCFFVKTRKEDENTTDEEEHPFHTFLQKVQFSGERGLQVTGILNDADKDRLRDLANPNIA